MSKPPYERRRIAGSTKRKTSKIDRERGLLALLFGDAVEASASEHRVVQYLEDDAHFERQLLKEEGHVIGNTLNR